MLAVLGACAEEPPASGVEDRPHAAASTSGDDVIYSCGGGVFPVTAIEEARPPSDELLAAIEKLRKSPEGHIIPPEGWFVVAETRKRATLLAPLRHEFGYATFEREGKTWASPSWGGCTPRLHVPGKSVLRWAFTEDAYPPDPGATELQVLATETGCSSARDIEGLIEADVEYREDRIDVVLTAPGLDEKGVVAYTCQGTPPTEYEVVLSEPVGEREVFDPSVYPPREPDPETSLP